MERYGVLKQLMLYEHRASLSPALTKGVEANVLPKAKRTIREHRQVTRYCCDKNIGLAHPRCNYFCL
jgi:hypothetical protein